MDELDVGIHDHRHPRNNQRLYTTGQVCPVYEDVPLDGSKRQLRLLQLESRTSTLHFRLTTVSLEDEPDYIALSYCWDLDAEQDPVDAEQDPVDAEPRPVCINKYMFGITPNLDELLKKLSSSPRKRWLLLLDRICIDQSNEEWSKKERSSQIQLMGDIYASAREVVAWLGPREMIGEEPTITRAWEDAAHDRVPASSFTDSFLPQRYRFLNYSLVTNSVTSSRYWTRLWIVQELVLARSIVLMSGDGKLDLDTYKNSVDKIIEAIRPNSAQEIDITTSGTSNMMGFNNVAQPYVILNTREKFRRVSGRSKMALHELITTFGGQKSTKPEDMVFGFLGMAETRITANVEISLTELYARVLVEALTEIYAGRDPKKATPEILPTLGPFCIKFLRALGFSNFNLAVHLITRHAIERKCGPEAQVFPPIWQACLEPASGIRFGGWPWLQTILDAHEMLMYGPLIPVLPAAYFSNKRILQNKVRYYVQDLLVWVAQHYNMVLAMPDGELYTCQELITAIDLIVDDELKSRLDVQQRGTPVDLSTFSAQSVRPWHKWTAVYGRLCDLIVISLIGATLAYGGVMSGYYLDRQLGTLVARLGIKELPVLGWSLWILSSLFYAVSILTTTVVLVVAIPLLVLKLGVLDGIIFSLTGLDIADMKKQVHF